MGHSQVNEYFYCGSCRRIERKGVERLFKEVVAENFPNLRRDMDIQILGTQRTPSRINPKTITLRHIIMAMLKVKDERTLTEARENDSSHTKEPPKAVSGFLCRNLAGQ